VRRAREFAPNADVREMPDLAHDFLEMWYGRNGRSTGANGHCVINPLATPRAHPGEFAALIDALCQRYRQVTLATAQPGEEVAMLRSLPSRPSNLDVFVSGDWEPPLHLLSRADVVVAERFHYIAAAAHAGAKVIPVIQTAKARHLSHLLGLSDSSIDGKTYRAAKVLAQLDTLQPPATDRLQALARDVRSTIAHVEQQRALPARYSTNVQRAARTMTREILAWGWNQKRHAAVKRLRRK
ncbi:MAG TPA: hypothetical protein VHF69_00765, partial [Candidatus Synoicihabitans sp.]|nr:hypothetical protein [Candidatus Synoicihabitans sp.]